MGLSGAFGCRVLFALPPEPAHRLAGTLLRLPLPWSAIGGNGRDHPSLEVSVGGLRLPNPVGLAAGFDKDARYLRGLSRLGFGYLVVGTVTRAPRPGNPRPRIVRRPDRRSLVNAMGLPNRGAESMAARLRRAPRRVPVLVSLADEALEDVLAAHAILEPLADGVELNASCPNVSWGRDRDNEEHLGRLLAALRSRRTKPLFVKVPPYRTGPERDAVLALAHVAQELGADGLTCSNTYRVSEPRLSVGAGGVSGRDLFEDTLRIVAEVREATGGELSINACGGIFSAEDALACLGAGATTVQVYTGLVYEGPRIARGIVAGLAAARGRAPAVAGP